MVYKFIKPNKLDQINTHTHYSDIDIDSLSSYFQFVATSGVDKEVEGDLQQVQQQFVENGEQFVDMLDVVVTDQYFDNKVVIQENNDKNILRILNRKKN